MKIRAIRVAEVGPFFDGVAVEDLSGGLDVLTGPNETGKSTLFRALTTLIGDKYTSTAQSVQRLRSDYGGAPLIEADLELGGRTWRLTKRYLAQRSAELIELTGNARWRGADAERELQALLAQSGYDVLRGVLWVEQAASFSLPKSEGDLAAALSALIEQEATEVAGVGQARVVRAKVAERLGELVTSSTGRPKKGGLLEIALSAHAAIAGDLAAAEDRALRASERTSRLAELKSRLADLRSPATLAELADRIATAERAFSEATQARSRLESAEQRLATRRVENDQALSRLELFDAGIKELERLRGDVARLAAHHERTSADRLAMEQRREAFNQQRQAVADSVEVNRRRLAARRAADARSDAERTLEGLALRLGRANAAAEAIAALASSVAAYRVDRAGLDGAWRLSARLGAAKEQLEAAAARITVEYTSGGVGRIQLGGAPVAHGVGQLVSEPVELVVDGIGTIRIEPAAVSSAVAVEQRNRVRAELDELLSRMGTADMTSAEQQLDLREADERALAAARANLAAEAPDGLATLVSQHQAASRRLADLVAKSDEFHIDDILEECAALEAREHELRSALADRDEALRAVSDELNAMGEALARLDAERAAHARRIEELSQLYPKAEEAAVRRAELAPQAARAEEALAEAVRERSAWAAVAPDAAALAALKDAAEQARAASRRRETTCAELDLEMAELEGALRRDRAEGAGADIALLKERLAGAQARVADLELEVSALSLLRDRLDCEHESLRETVMRPLVNRLQPLLEALFPGARVALEGPLLTTEFDRDGRSEAVGRLSDGTREQIATLVRLAYARMMVDRGSPMPLILDDALVFSDDTRLAAMFRLLSEAAKRHQVLVLSCREQVFEPLLAGTGACRLSIDAWDWTRSVPGRAGGGRRSAARRSAFG
ncbi:MAG: AAA family ATPase [Hyphomicrobiaceae bacterium]